MPRVHDEASVEFDQPFDPSSESPSIDAGVDPTGLDYNPKTGSFTSTGRSGGGGGGFAGGGGSQQPPTLPSRSIPGMHEAVPGPIGSQGVSGVPGMPPVIPGRNPMPPGSDAPNVGNGGNLNLPDGLLAWLRDPRNLATLAALIPSLAQQFTGGSGRSSEELALLDEARQGMALQRQRLAQTQPVFDTLVRMAYGNAPTRHRGEPPAGYQAPTGGYTYTPPRFGGR